MGDFDFDKCTVENDMLYCTDKDGDVYEMPLPKKITVYECSACTLKKLLAARGVNKMPRKMKRLSSGKIVAYDDIAKKWKLFTETDILLEELTKTEIVEAVELLTPKKE